MAILGMRKVAGTACINCKEDGCLEIKDRRFERINGTAGYIPVSCTLCGATFEMHYKLTHCENLELDEE